MYVFLANPAKKIVFYLPHKNRMLYRPEKLSFQKVQKIRILQRGGGGGWVHVFCQKIELLIMCVFLANQFRKYRFLIFSCKKESFLDQKIKVWKKSNKSNFLKGVSPQFLSKTRSFYYLCFLGKSSHKKNRFWKFWIKKNAFETRKRKFSKLLSYGNFQRG